MFFFVAFQVLPGGESDPHATSCPHRAAPTREVLREDLQRHLPLHPQHLRGVRLLPVSLLPLLLGRAGPGSPGPRPPRPGALSCDSPWPIGAQWPAEWAKNYGLYAVEGKGSLTEQDYSLHAVLWTIKSQRFTVKARFVEWSPSQVSNGGHLVIPFRSRLR